MSSLETQLVSRAPAGRNGLELVAWEEDLLCLICLSLTLAGLAADGVGSPG